MSGSYGQPVVPTQDTNSDIFSSDVIGKKSDTTAGTSLVAMTKGINNRLNLPIADSANNMVIADVIGNKSDTKVGTSLMSVLKNNEEQVQQVKDWLAEGGIPTFPMPANAADGVSLAEVIRFISDLQLTHTAIKAIPNMTGYDTGVVFTVMGAVLVRIFGTVGATAITSTSGTTTISVGTTADPDVCLPATTIDNSDFAIGDAWCDNNPEDDACAIPSGWILVNNANIYLTRSADDITAGALDLMW